MELTFSNAAILIFFGLFVYFIFSIPHEYFHGYSDWVQDTHGNFVIFSISALFILISFAILMMIAVEVTSTLLKITVIASAIAWIVLNAYDNYKYFQTR